MSKIAFIGLGVMGYPMAGHLLRRGGHDVTVHNRTAAVAARWVAEHGGRAADTPRAAAADADWVFTCVGDDPDVRAVILGPDGALAGMRPGAALVDHTTASADMARALRAAADERGVDFVDAPVSGGQKGAADGALTIMCGGTEAACARAAAVMAAYSRTCRRVGPSGAGQLAKMVNQICIAGLVQGLAEGVHFGMKAGLDMEAVIDVISGGAAGSWQMENRAATMRQGEFDFGFAVDWMRKDLRLCLTEARRGGARLPVAALVDQLYAQVQARGGGRWDTSSLIDLLNRP